MKKLITLSALMFLLSACSWGGSTPSTSVTPENKPSPYPTTTISGEIVLDMTPAVGENYSLKGTEPFWSAEITASETTLSRPGEKDTIVKKYETRQNDK
jgi:uncharacterized membrane protein